MTLAMISPGRPCPREISRFEAVVRSQTARLWPIACTLTGEREAGKQVLKQCFSALAPRLEDLCNVEVADWLRRRVILACLELIHERARTAEQEIEALLPRFDAAGRHERRPLDVHRDAHGTASAACRRSYREGLERLPRAYRDVVLLCDVLKLEPRRAAELLNLRQGLLRYRLHQARLALREHVESERAR